MAMHRELNQALFLSSLDFESALATMRRGIVHKAKDVKTNKDVLLIFSFSSWMEKWHHVHGLQGALMMQSYPESK